jgi:hypothetical protein
VVERRLSAERGWIGPPQPVVEWHMPAWVKTGGRHFLSHRQSARLPRQEPWPGLEVSSDSVDDWDTIDGGK